MSVHRDLRRLRRGRLAARVTPELIREGGAVREVRVPPLVPPLARGSVADIPFANAAEAQGAVVVRRKEGDRWVPVTAAAFAARVTEVAKGLVAAGLPAGGRVALMARTSADWVVLDFAIWAAGGVTVPVYATSSADQVAWILRDSGASFLVVETAAHAGTAEQGRVESGMPTPWVIDDGALDKLAGLGRTTPDAAVDERRAALGPDTVATVVYTSGTTGRPRGCALTHRNLHAEATTLVALLKPVFEEATGQTPTTLVFLPLAHILGRAIQIACLSARIETGHCPSVRPDDLRPELASFRPTFLVGVPYLFEKIHDTGRATAERIGRGASFDRADRVGVAYGEARMRAHHGTGPGPGPGLRLAKALYDVLVYRRIRKALGGRVRYAISGGSPLDPRLTLFFFGCGIVVYEGYGLTETTAAATLSPPLAPRPGTVGLPLPGTAVRIADDGEVLIRGGIVTTAYWNAPEATERALDDGWFATGDLGVLDDEGYLAITGRKKDILVTSGGKNVSPAPLEDRLRGRPPIGACMVVGDNRPFVAALISLEREALDHWLTVRGRPAGTPVAELREDPELLATVRRAVDHANESVSRAESIRAFALVDGEFTEENGMLTPSLKVRRQAVATAYAAEIERLYDRSS
ncbi:AMP-dependent synthetase/ligase [Streptomyces radicis]|uniref:Long-chain fatty acid--CoA ligase n=1 Tax=Streptomyces radicis TaxID=1750517 RepID=A0A3A9VS18_9ACTN|nr:AMP-dependent synthetase/ligase [Streptomyces radicis]RKN03835.1 long-chain fatty acid--CoA ligase [Streptomyces radicis]RKN13926.1 long-chain fatty acid--CoA ligase [Streptomyces radicis]